MSKIGKQPVILVSGVEAVVTPQKVVVKGPKGTLEFNLPKNVSVTQKENSLIVERKGNSKIDRAIFGTTRALLANMAKGVTTGWSKQLELVGTGFRAEVQGGALVLNVGFSHQIKVPAPLGITFKVEKLVITVEGADKELVGRIASEIRKVRPPEPYKGKGIKYVGEIVRRKAGKAAAKTTAA